MLKVIEKVQDDIARGIVSCYTPASINLKNFNPRNLSSLTVSFGVPITNKKSKTDGLYFAPECIRGESSTSKSVAFSVGVIWDELLHYKKFFNNVSDL
jgi:hypothetical protein